MSTSDRLCTRCNAVHDPCKCQGHVDEAKARAYAEGGREARDRVGLAGGGPLRQCQLKPCRGQKICWKHGGKAAQVKTAAANRATEAELRKTLGRLAIVPVANPLAELQHLAGEAAAWKALCAEHVANLERMRYSTDGGEAIRGEILLFERAMDRCAQILATVAKLNIDDRLVAIAEAQKDMVIKAIEAAFAAAGIGGSAAVEAKKVAARHLRAVG